MILLLHHIILYLLDERRLKRIMTTDKIRDKKLQYNINREAARLSELSTGKVDKQVTLHKQQILSNLSK